MASHDANLDKEFAKWVKELYDREHHALYWLHPDDWNQTVDQRLLYKGNGNDKVLLLRCGPVGTEDDPKKAKWYVSTRYDGTEPCGVLKRKTRKGLTKRDGPHKFKRFAVEHDTETYKISNTLMLHKIRQLHRTLDQACADFIEDLHKEIQHHTPFFWQHPKKKMLYEETETGTTFLLHCGDVDANGRHDTWKATWYASRESEDVKKFGILYETRKDLCTDKYKVFLAPPCSITYSTLRATRDLYRYHPGKFGERHARFIASGSKETAKFVQVHCPTKINNTNSAHQPRSLLHANNDSDIYRSLHKFFKLKKRGTIDLNVEKILSNSLKKALEGSWLDVMKFAGS
jgi:hypothetical protein